MTNAAPTTLDTAAREALAELLLSVADDEFVIGFWDSEWTGIAPMLEEDVATSSIAQDEIGHARALYELLAELTDDDADRIAYGRSPDDFRHAALLNHARGDWAFSVARRYLYETADAVRLTALAGSSHEPLAALAGKMRREETYHLLHADAWLRRLAEAGPETRERLASSLRSAVDRCARDLRAAGRRGGARPRRPPAEPDGRAPRRLAAPGACRSSSRSPARSPRRARAPMGARGAPTTSPGCTASSPA